MTITQQGPGRYDAECTELRESTKARAVALVVLFGERGNGFSVQVEDAQAVLLMADALEMAAKDLRARVQQAYM